MPERSDTPYNPDPPDPGPNPYPDRAGEFIKTQATGTKPHRGQHFGRKGHFTAGGTGHHDLFDSYYHNVYGQQKRRPSKET